MRKPAFYICENKDADQLRGNRESDQHLCFRYTDSKSLYYLNPKFQASSHLLPLCSLVCVGPGRKPRSPVFSQQGSYEAAQTDQPLLCLKLSSVLEATDQTECMPRLLCFLLHAKPLI